MTAKEKLQNLKGGRNVEGTSFFRPILMNFAAHHIGKTYSDFAKHHEVLVEANLKCMKDFGPDAVGLISGPYRETAAFGAEITFPEDDVPRCTAPIIKSLKDARELSVPDTEQAERTRNRILAAWKLRHSLGESVPIIGWIEGPLAEACDLAGISEMLLKTASDEMFTGTLLEKTEETAIRFAEAQIDAGCEITVKTPPENLRAMRDALHDVYAD
jgi:uroporphyrinogen-III decarboxylase